MEVKKDITNATRGEIHTETSIPAVGKYKAELLGKAAAVAAIKKNNRFGYYVSDPEKVSRGVYL